MDVLFPILEWADALCIAAYASLSVLMFGSLVDSTGLGIDIPAGEGVTGTMTIPTACVVMEPQV